MYIDSKGIIFRRTKTTDMRSMLLIFTEKYGKLSVGTNLAGKNKKRGSLALRPFTCGNYQIYKGRNYYNLDRVETVRSFYGIGEDPDKYMAASLALELAEKTVPEEVPQQKIFSLLLEFLSEIETRKQRYLTLLLAFEAKLLSLLGMFPVLDSCACCSKAEDLSHFSVEEGGLICRDCFERCGKTGHERLIFKLNFDIVNVLNYFITNPLKTFENIALKEEVEEELQKIMRSYISFHMDVGKLKSDKMLSDKL